MKKLLILSLLASLVGCSSTHQPQAVQPQTQYAPTGPVGLLPIKDPFKQMDRADVIQAARDCINAKMKPVVQNLPQQTTHGVIVVPVFVACEFYRD